MIILRSIFPGTNLLPCSYFHRISSSHSPSHLNVRRVTDSERSLLEQKYNPPVYLCFISLDFYTPRHPLNPCINRPIRGNPYPTTEDILMLCTNIPCIRIHNLIINTPIPHYTCTTCHCFINHVYTHHIHR